MTGLGEDRFGMELHSLDGVLRKPFGLTSPSFPERVFRTAISMPRSSSFTTPVTSPTSRSQFPAARSSSTFRKLSWSTRSSSTATARSRTTSSRRSSRPSRRSLQRNPDSGRHPDDQGAYAATGRSEVEVTTQVVPLGEGRVNLAFVINEGDRTKIDSINFVGNNAYSAGRLAAVIATKRIELPVVPDPQGRLQRRQAARRRRSAAPVLLQSRLCRLPDRFVRCDASMTRPTSTR